MIASLLTVSPKITKVGGRLVARTCFLVKLLTLFLSNRRVEVDPARREVKLVNRWFWLIPSVRLVRFDEIVSVLYEYKDVSGGGYLSGRWQGHDAVDCFSVKLKLRGLRTVHIFSFFGEGSFTNETGLPDWWFGTDYYFDMQGNQDAESRVFVELLTQMIGCPINL